VAGSRGRRLAVWLILGVLLFVTGVGLTAAFLGRRLPLGGDRVAVITVEGVIADARDVIEQFQHYQDLPNVKAVVLRVDSPGGPVAPSQEIYQEILRFRRESKKPVVASVGSVAASGGYYIAAAADRIVANPGSLMGSIGVILQVPNLSGLLQKVGIKPTIIKSGDKKDLVSMTRDLTEAERRILQEVLDDVHGQFIDAVAAGRHMDRIRVEPLADGRVFSGRQALALGLVDELGNLPDAIGRAGALGGMAGQPKTIQERKHGFSLWDLLTQGVGLALSPSGTGRSMVLEYLWQ